METNDPKALQEVWEWKEKLYEQIKDLPGDEQLKYIIANAKKTLEEFRASLKSEKEKNNSPTPNAD